MSAKKIEAFTIMELVVSMFISMLLIGMAYFLLNTISFYFRRLDQNAEVVAERQLMRLMLRNDIEEADSIVALQEGISFFMGSDSLRWKTTADSMIRTSSSGAKGFYTGEVQLATTAHKTLGVVEQLELSFVQDFTEEPYHFIKHYPLKHFVR